MNNAIEPITRCVECGVWNEEARVMPRKISDSRAPVICVMCADYARATVEQTRASEPPYATPTNAVTERRLRDICSGKHERYKVDAVVDETNLNRDVAEELCKRYRLISRR